MWLLCIVLIVTLSMWLAQSDPIRSLKTCSSGDIVEDAVKGALGIKDKEEDKKKGGFMSIFKGNKDDEEEEKKKDEDKGFFSKIFHKDDDEDEGLKKKSGFHGLFTEGGGAMGGGEEAGGNPGQTVAVSDRDLFDDLVEVAEETSKN